MRDAITHFAQGFGHRPVSWYVRHRSRAYNSGFNTACFMLVAVPAFFILLAGVIVGRAL